MYRVGIKKKGCRKGFTLIEMLVSLVLFVIFLGMVSSSYVNIVRAQKDANEIRKMYSEVRNFVDFFSEEVRLSSIDYDCYGGTVFYSNICETGLATIATDGRTTDLALVRKDGLEKTIFRYDPDGKKIFVRKYEKDALGNWGQAPGYADGFREAMGNVVSVEKMSFAINPDKNPYGQENAYNNAKQFQPKVTLYMTVKNGANAKSQFQMDFQTTISSRVYSRL